MSTPTTPTASAPESSSVIAALVAVARAAWQLADNTEQSGEEYRCDPGDFSKLSAMLEALDELDDPPGESATGPRKAEYWLSAEAAWSGEQPARTTQTKGPQDD